MTKLFITIIVFLTSILGNAQQYSKKDFVKTDWFTNNLDSLFFTSDTVKLIKYMNKGVEEASAEYAEYEMKYLGHGDYLNLGFKRFGEVEYWETYNNYMNSMPWGPFSWKFDRADGTLTVYRENELFFKLKPIASREIQIVSRFNVNEGFLLTEEWTFIKV